MSVGIENEPKVVPFRIGHTTGGMFVIDIPKSAVGVQAMQPADAMLLAASIIKSALLAQGKPVHRHMMVSLP